MRTKYVTDQQQYMLDVPMQNTKSAQLSRIWKKFYMSRCIRPKQNPPTPS